MFMVGKFGVHVSKWVSSALHHFEQYCTCSVSVWEASLWDAVRVWYWQTQKHSGQTKIWTHDFRFLTHPRDTTLHSYFHCCGQLGWLEAQLWSKMAKPEMDSLYDIRDKKISFPKPYDDININTMPAHVRWGQKVYNVRELYNHGSLIRRSDFNQQGLHSINFDRTQTSSYWSTSVNQFGSDKYRHGSIHHNYKLNKTMWKKSVLQYWQNTFQNLN